MDAPAASVPLTALGRASFRGGLLPAELMGQFPRVSPRHFIAPSPRQAQDNAHRFKTTIGCSRAVALPPVNSPSEFPLPLNAMHSLPPTTANAAELVDKIIEVWLRLEGEIDRFLTTTRRDSRDRDRLPSPAHMTFKGKLDALRDEVEAKWQTIPEARAAFNSWHTAMEAYRMKRNALVDGGWSFSRGETTNLGTRLPDAAEPPHTSYTLAELTQELCRATELEETFRDWASHWRVD